MRAGHQKDQSVMRKAWNFSLTPHTPEQAEVSKKNPFRGERVGFGEGSGAPEPFPRPYPWSLPIICIHDHFLYYLANQ